MLEHDHDLESTSPAWISFADLMTGLLGAFVLLLVGVSVMGAMRIYFEREFRKKLEENSKLMDEVLEQEEKKNTELDKLTKK